MQAIDFVAKPNSQPIPAVVAVFGDEPFLKRLALLALRKEVLGADNGDFSLASFPGKTATLRDVLDELSTMAMFGGGRRLVIVEEADDFVSGNRADLEKLVANPPRQGVLVLEVKSWAANTKLAKAVAATGLDIDCKSPAANQIVKWLCDTSESRHNVKLRRPEAELMVDMVGPELGLLDQEVAKLATAVGPGGQITSEKVHELVGGWRAKTAWDLLDAAAAGNAADALKQLDKLMLAGEAPIAVLGQIAFSLRRYAAAARVFADHEASGGRAPSLKDALVAAGVKPVPFIMKKSEEQLKQIGRRRAVLLYRWLLDADLALKGHSSAPGRARGVLERLIARLSKSAA